MTARRERGVRGDSPGREIDPGLFFVLAIASAATFHRVVQQIARGPGWDTYGFLANAAEFAGRGFGYTEPHRPPMLSMITSVFYRFLPLDEVVILWVDGALSVLGVVALYWLFSRRFERAFAAAGALSMLALPPLWDYLGRGYTDFATVALSALALFWLVKATEENANWYLLALPTLAAAGLMRFNSLLFVMPALMWIVFRSRPFREIKQLVVGAFLALMAYVPPAIFYVRRFDDVLFPFTVALGMVETATVAEGQSNVGTEMAGLWYLSNAPMLMTSENLSVAALVVLVIGFSGLMISYLGYAIQARPSARMRTFALLGAGIAILPQLMGTGLMLRQAGIMIGVFVIWQALASRPDHDSLRRLDPSHALDAVMLAWLLGVADYNAHLFLVVPRYFIPMAPGVIYFALRGFSAIVDSAASFPGIRSAPVREGIGVAARATFALFVIAGLVTTIASGPPEKDRLVEGARQCSDWMLEQGEDLTGMTLYSDLWPLASWYLQANVKPMPTFKDEHAYEHELEKYEVDYYMTIRSTEYAVMNAVFEESSVRVLERRATAQTDHEGGRILYLGKAWDNYLEESTGFSFELISTAGRYGREGTAYIDSMTAEQMREYDAVAGYRVRWNDRTDADKVLEEYVSGGGVLFIDASANLDAMESTYAGTVLLETIIKRDGVPADARIELSPDFADRHGLDTPLDSDPFLSESNEGWFGAAYESLPAAESTREVLATIGGKPLVTLQYYGEGRVYWISQNLVWHAFFYENADERAFLTALFEEGLSYAKEDK